MYNFGQQIIKVNGENGARAYQMMPNSSALLLDETAPLVWLKETDAVGYPSLSAFKIEPYTPEPKPDLKQLMERLISLEERLNSNEQQQSHRTSNEKKQQ